MEAGKTLKGRTGEGEKKWLSTILHSSWRIENECCLFRVFSKYCRAEYTEKEENQVEILDSTD